MLVKPDVFDVKQRSKKVQTGPAAPTPIVLVKNKEEGGRADLKNAGVEKFSSESSHQTNKIGFGAVGHFCTFLHLFVDTKNVDFDQNEISVR